MTRWLLVFCIAFYFHATRLICRLPPCANFQNAHEFSELPVRHNEDQVNSELAVKLPLPVDPHTYDSSNTKTHLLLQAHFSRVPLPSADYHTDTKSVMDQVLRVLQVHVYVALFLVSAKTCMSF